MKRFSRISLKHIDRILIIQLILLCLIYLNHNLQHKLREKKLDFSLNRCQEVETFWVILLVRILNNHNHYLRIWFKIIDHHKEKFIKDHERHQLKILKIIKKNPWTIILVKIKEIVDNCLQVNWFLNLLSS